MKTIIYKGKKFTKDIKSGYYLSSSEINGSRMRLHRFVWEMEKGPIPTGMHVHHIDENKDNNDMSNLTLLTPKQHEMLHGKERMQPNTQKTINFQKKGIKSAKAWHKTAEGHEWHKKHFEETKESLYKKVILACQECGKQYETINHGENRFCSNKCKSKWRRDNHLDDVERTCTICGKKFNANKYTSKKTCSRECSLKSRSKTRWGKS